MSTTSSHFSATGIFGNPEFVVTFAPAADTWAGVLLRDEERPAGVPIGSLH
jgi:hypothetical protein